MVKDCNREAFLELVRAGLWGKEVQLSTSDIIDFSAIYQLAQEQSVIGLVAAGLEQVKDVIVPQKAKLVFAGTALQMEQHNREMNAFIANLVEQLRQKDISALLLKGQGVAQCYERPLWRASGDVDLLFDADNYKKAVNLLKPLASNCKEEGRYSKHLGLTIGQWYVELHGTMRSGLSSRVDREIDAVLEDTFKNHKVRVWNDGETAVDLSSPDNDVFIVFTHFIKHYYKERLTLRQLCDWCRLLWTYKNSLNYRVLETRIRKAGLLSEWKAFSALVVEYLGMPVEAMPFYSEDKKWSKKAEKIVAFILKGGKWQRFKDTIKVGTIFPMNTIRFLPGILFSVNWLKIKERIFKR